MATREQILKDNEHLRGKMSDSDIIALANHLAWEDDVELHIEDSDSNEIDNPTLPIA